ncbi:MAG: hypothetical protein ACYCQK_05455 [Acidiferrobacteraceae bacterium]
MKSWMLVVGIFCAMMSLGMRSAEAWERTVPWGPGHSQVVQVDDDDEGDHDNWIPWWFGMQVFAPRRRVIVERHYYYSEPPQQYEAPPPQNYLYFCQDPEGYYPQVRECDGGWMRVIPGGAPPP